MAKSDYETYPFAGLRPGETLVTSSTPSSSDSKIRKSRRAAIWMLLGLFFVAQIAVSRFDLKSYTIWGCSGGDLRSARSVGAQGTIAWCPCPDLTEYDCAYLTVPMDYTDPHPNETVSLALRRLPATAPVKERLGTVITNPGGPGGSGHAAVVAFGKEISVILQGKYDILGFDPRGVNMTTPSLGCYNHPAEEKLQLYQTHLLGLSSEARNVLPPAFRTSPASPNSTGSSFEDMRASSSEMSYLRKVDATMRIPSLACEKNGREKMLRSVSTAFVARDMASIVDALGEEHINYWGFSYGTILGATFAAMFPEKVNRMVLDGTVNAQLYTNSMYDSGRSSMADTNKTYGGFLSSCVEAGPGRCALATTLNTTVESLANRMSELVQKLLDDPLPVISSKSGSGLVTPSSVLFIIFRSLYSPTKWPRLATALSELEKGSGKALFDFWSEVAFGDGTFDKKTSPDENAFHRFIDDVGSPLTTVAIMCGDSEGFQCGRENEGDDELRRYGEYIRELEALSPIGGHWALYIGRCRRWKIRPIEAYRGPWTVEDGLRKTRFPVLFASMTGDPVTPLSAAKFMSSGFGNQSASLVIQNGYGHTTSAQPSICTAKTLRSYFLDGVVPPYGNICDSDEGFLFPSNGIETMSQVGDVGGDKADRDLVGALRRIAEVLPSLMFRANQ